MKKYYTPKTKTISLEAEELLAISQGTAQSVWSNLGNGGQKSHQMYEDEDGWHITKKNGDHDICIRENWHLTPVMNGIIED